MLRFRYLLKAVTRYICSAPLLLSPPGLCHVQPEAGEREKWTEPFVRTEMSGSYEQRLHFLEALNP